MSETAKIMIARTHMPILPDLKNTIDACKKRLAQFDPDNEVIVDNDLWARIRKSYLEQVSGDSAEVIGGHTLKITTPEGRNLAISCQELPQCWAVIPYYNALKLYEKTADELAKSIGFTNRTSGDAREVFSIVPSSNWKNTISSDIQNKISNELPNILNGDSADIRMFYRFLEDPVWSGVAKKLNRNDWIEAAVEKAGQWLAVGAARRGELVAALAKDSSIEPLMHVVIKNAKPAKTTLSTPTERLKGGNNTIYYGAPGTGKSYRVDNLSKDAHVIRTVFHPDVQNSDFVGSLKPVREDGDITYRFSPGPFAIALVDAMNNPGKEVWLVIEELNRAPAAAVFGDLFLLLDRDEDGTGEYDVNCPSEEFSRWYEEQTGEKSGKIRLPSNLWIAATMNSADQGVYPLDTAFRRRWIQEYIPIEYDKGPDGKITVMQTGGGEIPLDWRAFVKILNDHLTDEISIAEDRLVGPWFVKEAELGDAGVLPGKVLIYLWDDLLRHHGRDVIFNGGIKSYGSLSTKSGSGEAIFSEGFLSHIIKDAKPGVDE